MFRKLLLVLAGAGVLGLTGCVSQPVKMASKPGREYQVIGKAEGSGGGVLLFSIIPCGQNQRFEKAYQEAVQRGKGDDLINPQVHESWYWIGVGNLFLTTVEGDVIKYKGPATMPSAAPRK